MRRWTLAVAAVAAVSFFVALVAGGAAFEGYSQLVHPVALLGARGVSHALAFDVFGFALPGLLAAWVAWRLREAVGDGARWPARIGAWLALLAALAFAAQGVLALDPGDLESSASHMHATAWTLWWVAFAAAALLLAIGARAGGGFTAACGLAALALIALELLPHPLAPALAQRLAFAIWLVWLLAAAQWVDASRRPGSQHP